MNMNGMDAGGARGQTPDGHMGGGDPDMRVFKPPDAAPDPSIAIVGAGSRGGAVHGKRH